MNAGNAGNVLVVNAGSGSLKLDLLDGADERVRTQDIDAHPSSDQAHEALRAMLEDDRVHIDAVGYRVAHGGPDLTAPTLLDDDTVHQLEQVSDLAPLHVPPVLAAIDTCREHLPDVPHVACFDTAFHADLPEAARTYAVPQEWRTRYGVRRYGFHGLSYAWALRRTAALLDRPVDDLHVVLAHLGGGASVCAVSAGRSVWTSMGFTPLEGLVMVERSGTVDPGMLLWLQTQHGLTADDLTDALNHRSGLLALSDGRSGDTRELVRAAAEGDAASALALDVYTLRARQEIAAAAACLPRLDALVLTGEIGADQPEVREAISAGLPVLGLPGGLDVRQDDDRVLSPGGRGPGDAAASGRPAVLLVHPREDRQVAREVRGLLAAR